MTIQQKKDTPVLISVELRIRHGHSHIYYWIKTLNTIKDFKKSLKRKIWNEFQKRPRNKEVWISYYDVIGGQVIEWKKFDELDENFKLVPYDTYSVTCGL